MIGLVQSVSNKRWCWIALMVLGLALEGCGLYFQYGLRLDPCVNCVYERAFYLSFIVAGLIGFLSPAFILTRLLAILIFMAGSIGGMCIAFDHAAQEYQHGFGSVCKLTASFPSFLPLDELMPWMFKPTGACGPLDWSLLGLSMPQWILLSFAVGTLVSVTFFAAEFFKKKKKSYFDYYR